MSTSSSDPGFKYLEHTGDLFFKAYGSTLGECFSNAGKALFSYVTDLSKIGRVSLKSFNLEAESLETLMHDFLSELLYFFEVEGFIPSGFNVSVDEQSNLYKLSANILGDFFNREKHVIYAHVKAVTYHKLKVRRSGNKYIAEVLCDI